MKAFKFVGFDLQSGPYNVQDSGDLFNSPEREIIYKELARADYAVSVYRHFKPRSFMLAGSITTESSIALEDAIDEIKRSIMNQRGELEVGWGTGSRFYEAECTDVKIVRKQADVSLCGWLAPFFMARPFATDGSTQNLITAFATTAGAITVGTSNIGTYLALPYITLTITAIEPNNAAVDLVITNPSSSESLLISRVFLDGDVVTIDTLTKQVFHNSELISPVGTYPAWAPGGGLFDFTDNATSRNISISATYEPRYL